MAPCYFLCVEVTAEHFLSSLLLVVFAVHDTLVPITAAQANPIQSQPLLCREAEGEAQAAQSLMAGPRASSPSPARPSAT